MLQQLILALCVALFTSAGLSRLLIERGPKDTPGEARKAHVAPTPTSGGLAIAAGAVAGVTAAAADVWAFWPAIIFPLAFLAIGALDDVEGLPAQLKFPLFAAMSAAGALAAGPVEALPLGGGSALVLPFAVGVAGTALWIFTLVNAVNFIDGSNGLAMGSLAIALCALTALAWGHGLPGLAVASACCVASIVGFLFWNFPGGRIFAGDAGALSIGAFAAFASLALIEHGGVSPFVPPILFFPILADVLLTMLWRTRRGLPLMEAHADHLYQRALRSWRSHARVAIAFWALMALCAGGVLLLAARPGSGLDAAALLALAATSIAFSQVARRRATHHNASRNAEEERDAESLTR